MKNLLRRNVEKVAKYVPGGDISRVGFICVGLSG